MPSFASDPRPDRTFTEFRIIKNLYPLDVDCRRWKWSIELQAIIPDWEFRDGTIGPRWMNASWAFGVLWERYERTGRTRSQDKALRKMHEIEVLYKEMAHHHNALAMTQETRGRHETWPL